MNAERCRYCGAMVESPCDEPPPDTCERALNATYYQTKSITCPRCAMVSYNRNDIEQGYCGSCHDWTSL